MAQKQAANVILHRDWALERALPLTPQRTHSFLAEALRRASSRSERSAGGGRRVTYPQVAQRGGLHHVRRGGEAASRLGCERAAGCGRTPADQAYRLPVAPDVPQPRDSGVAEPSPAQLHEERSVSERDGDASLNGRTGGPVARGVQQWLALRLPRHAPAALDG